MHFRSFIFCLAIIGFFSWIFPQVAYNHPELNWKTFETDHFMIHFYDGTEHSAREGAVVAENIYPFVTDLYDYAPPVKTHIIFTDTDDIANGAAYYYDNKIIIWTMPLDFELRGSHRWLQNVITHEFTHIVSMQKAMKAGLKYPGAYLQYMGYEDEKRQDVLYGFPNTLVSYPLPGTAVPPWLAEGTAQFMYEGADYDNWDTHRDMILRDRVLHNNLLTLTEMNTFGKSGIGNESTYNSGYAICRYIAVKHGSEKLKMIMENLSHPFQYSIDNAIEKVTGFSGKELYNNYKNVLEKRYDLLTETMRENEQKGKILISDGTTNLHPVWSPDGKRFAYISNKNNDYFGQTDLFIYTIDTKAEEKISDGVKSTPAWHPDGKTIYYTKKPKIPDKTGSKYFDLFEYRFEAEEETRLTKGTRAFSPVFIPSDSSIVFIATKDGSQNLHQFDFKRNIIRKLTDFDNHKIIHSLFYDSVKEWLIFDHTDHHFRNIGYLSLKDSTYGDFLNNALWDERDMTVSASGKIVYSDDRSGIFNLYQIDEESGGQGYITNVTGGAFMPDVNANGEILFSLYENGGYKIAFLDSVNWISEENVGYSSTYFLRNKNIQPPLLEQDTSIASTYEDNFPSMFILPKIMADYGTVKPGFYFYSSEILERLTLFGAASMNQLKDLDVFFLFEFKRFFPTLFIETYYLTRNINEKNQYSVIPVDDNLKFRLVQFRGGLRFPVRGYINLELYSIWQRYRASIKETVEQTSTNPRIEAGVAYDYYRGWTSGFRLNTIAKKPRSDGIINPSNGFEYSLDMAYEDNDFIDGLNLSEAGTLTEDFNPHDLVRVTMDGKMHWEIPQTNRWTISAETNLGWLSNTEADSFFNFFGGGLVGIQGYPFYSIEGNRMALGKLALRAPIFREKHYPLGWFILQNSVVGLIIQAGDAWNPGEGNFFYQFKLKRSIGFQWRFQGFSFYNFPTAIGLEIHRGLDKFEKMVGTEGFRYGNKNRWYFTLLFGF